MENAKSVVRYLVAVAVVIVAFWYASVLAGLIGWSLEPKGWDRVRDGLSTLAMSWAIATAGIAVARAVAGHPARSWWLILGLLPPVRFALSEGLGVW